MLHLIRKRKKYNDRVWHRGDHGPGQDQKFLPIGRAGTKFGPKFCVQSPRFWAEISGLLQAKTSRAKKIDYKVVFNLPKAKKIRADQARPAGRKILPKNGPDWAKMITSSLALAF